MKSYAKQLREKLIVHATNERRSGAEAYMRNQFVFLGIDTNTRRQIFKAFVSNSEKNPTYEQLSTIIKEMWNLERELQYCAVELAALYKEEWKEDFIEMIEFCIVTNSWWDAVDHIASEWTGPYFKKFPSQIKKITTRWNRSQNIWLQRSSIMFQKQYRSQTDTVLLSKYILHCAASNEFFIQKAIGWALREFAKSNPEWVRVFVEENTLKPLSRREALKNL